ncbi:hypothetical protein [Bradyrhizobium sp. RT10b]|uniref:hypothetical protein n=1 Tax=Bradyrhizobium sp. RT10b TaxID=3156331 RepID=UPI003391C58D
MTLPTREQLRKLNSYPCVDEVEDEGLDDGRFFVHLVEGFDWTQDPAQVTRTKSFDSYSDVRYWLDKRVKAVAAP